MYMKEFEYRFGLVFSEVLSPEHQMFVQQIIGYASVAHLRIPSGEGPSFTWLYDQGLIVDLDTTKTYSDDISFLFDEFFESIESYLKNGTKPYAKATRGKPAGFQRVPSVGFTSTILQFVSDEIDGGYYSDAGLVNAVESYMRLCGFIMEGEDLIDEDFDDKDTAEVDRVVTINVPEGAKKVTVTIEF